jgi:hypothetical protein
MAIARKKIAAKKTTAKNVKKAAKKAPARTPGLGRTVNMGPLRGDNSFPPSNKKMANNTSRAPVTKATKAHG